MAIVIDWRVMTEVATATATTIKELSPEEERVLIRDIAITAETNTKEGDSFFLITQKLIFFFSFPLFS